MHGKGGGMILPIFGLILYVYSVNVWHTVWVYYASSCSCIRRLVNYHLNATPTMDCGPFVTYIHIITRNVDRTYIYSALTNTNIYSALYIYSCIHKCILCIAIRMLRNWLESENTVWHQNPFIILKPHRCQKWLFRDCTAVGQSVVYLGSIWEIKFSTDLSKLCPYSVNLNIHKRRRLYI